MGGDNILGNVSLPGPKSSLDAESNNWRKEAEIALFKAILTAKRRPVGMYKRWNVVMIQSQLHREGFTDIKISDIYKHLSTLFDTDILDAMDEKIMKSHRESVVDFSLPKEDFQHIIDEMRKEGRIVDQGDLTTTKPASTKETGRKSSSGSKENTKKTVGKENNKKSSAKDKKSSGSTPRASSSSKGDENSKSSSSKRPTRSTPNSTPKRRK